MYKIEMSGMFKLQPNLYSALKKLKLKYYLPVEQKQMFGKFFMLKYVLLNKYKYLPVLLI